MPKPKILEPERRKPQWRLRPEVSTGQRLSRYELYSVVVSSLALVVAIAAAALQPILQARLFNEYAERGLLQVVSASIVSKKAPSSATGTSSTEAVYADQCRSCHEIDEDGNVEREFILTNFGHRPLSGVEIVCSGVALKAETQSVRASLRSVVTEVLSPESRTFKVSGALAPGERIQIRAKLQAFASVLARTEHGDSVALLGPGTGLDLTGEDWERMIREDKVRRVKPTSASPKQ